MFSPLLTRHGWFKRRTTESKGEKRSWPFPQGQPINCLAGKASQMSAFLVNLVRPPLPAPALISCHLLFGLKQERPVWAALLGEFAPNLCLSSWLNHPSFNCLFCASSRNYAKGWEESRLWGTSGSFSLTWSKLNHEIQLLCRKDVCSVCLYMPFLVFWGTFHWLEIPSDRPQEVKGPCSYCFPAGAAAPQPFQEVNVITSHEI